MEKTLLTQDHDLIVQLSKAMILHSGEPFTTSRQIAKEYGVRHNDLVTQIEELKHFDELFNLRKIRRLKYTYRGREFDYFELDEEVFLLVVGRIRTKKAEAATMKFINAFRTLLMENVAMKATIAANLSNETHRLAREKGKIARVILTDAVEAFCAYAVEMRKSPYLKKNGKPRACPYFKHFTNLSYKVLGLKVPPCNIDRRTSFNIADIERLETLEQDIADIIMEALDTGDDYHDLYKQVKKEVAR